MTTLQIPSLGLIREARRRQDLDACTTLHEFVKRSWHVIEPGAEFRDNWHLQAISEHLEAVSRREIKRLIINMPPRHMKSIGASVMWPAWEWGPNNKPSTRWLFATYAQSLSTRDSLKCRRLIQSPWYQERWGDTYQLTGDQNAKVRYDNDAMGYRLATSVGGALTGEGGDIIVVDDAHNVKDGESEAMREACIEWWDYAMSTRLNDPKTGAYVVVMQRVHDSDLVGHILARNNGWDHLCLPAEYESDHPTPIRSSIGFTDPRTEDGELLWPDRIGREELDELKATLGSYGAAGQLQQRPAPAGGGLFKREWFRYYEDMGEHYGLLDESGDSIRRVLKSDCWRFITCDLALTTKTYNDYSVYQVWDVEKNEDAKDKGQCMFLVEQWRERKEAPYVEDALRAAVERFDPLFIGIEDNSNFDTSVIQRFKRDGLPVRPIKPDRDKVTRASTASVWMENSKVWFPRRAPWLGQLEHELLLFPEVTHDDATDCLAYGVIFANRRDMWVAPPKPKLPPNSYGALLGMEEIFDDTKKQRGAFTLHSKK